MDADTILRIKPALTQYLHQFNDCMGRVTNREHLATYVSGQLSDLDRKSIEPMADAAGRSPRTLQEFLGLLKWDESSVRDRLQQRVAQRYADPNSIGIFDETSYHKQGKQTACVQRQHCGSRGKIENCVVSVHLGYVAGDTDGDGDVDLADFALLPACLTGPGGGPVASGCNVFDLDWDDDVDLYDVAAFANAFTGS